MAEGHESLGDRIRAVRVRRGLTQRELARRAAVDVAVINRLEMGERATVSLQVARRLARALNVSIDYLAGTFDDRHCAAEVALVGTADDLGRTGPAGMAGLVFEYTPDPPVTPTPKYKG